MTQVIQPDGRFIREVIASGGGDLKKCMQCATCSVVCTQSPPDAPFPRRQMAAAQWGLKEQVVADPALWLCHNCGECTTQCPRGAKPGEVMGALRAQAIKYFAFPRFMGELVSKPSGLPVLFLIPALIILSIALFSPRQAAAELEFASLFPVVVLEALFFAISGLVILVFGVSLARYVKAAGGAGPVSWQAAGEILTHKKFENCGNRRVGHLLIFWGFMGLALVGTSVGMGTMFFGMTTPLALTNPFKILANVAAAVIIVGIVLRVSSLRGSAYFDRFFFLTLAGVAATGILSELFRLAQSAALMYGIYYVHLVLVCALFLYAPYSKFAHLAYRTVAVAALRKERNGR